MNREKHAATSNSRTPERMPMRMTVVEYSWHHPPRRPRIVGLTNTRIMLALPIVAIFAAFIAALVVAGANW